MFVNFRNFLSSLVGRRNLLTEIQPLRSALDLLLRLLPEPRLFYELVCRDPRSSRQSSQKCGEADIGDSADMSPEDMDEGVMPVAFSDSDWERINYEEDSPIMEGSSLKITEIIDDDGIGPCDMPDEDILFGSDNEDAANVEFRHPGGSMSHSGLDLESWLSDSALLRIEAVRARVLANRHYCKYVKGNCMKQAALFTSLAVMLLPLIFMVLITVLCVSLVVSLCLLIPVVALGAGVVLTVIWNFWVSVPLFLMMAAVWIGADVFERLFKVPRKIVGNCQIDKN